MNLLPRPLVAAVCSLFVVLAGFPALAQRFLPAEIVQADEIDADQEEQIMIVVDPLMFDLTRDPPKPKDVAEARKQLLAMFRPNADPSPAFLEALSRVIESRMQPAATHESALVRINAMIVLGPMVDGQSVKWIDAGLKDKSDAVKRLAVQALGKRMLRWKIDGDPNNLIDPAIDQIVGVIDQGPPPHHVIVSSGFDALFKVSTTESRAALVELLNKRVALHAADPDLPYSAEYTVIESFAGVLLTERPTDMASITGLSRAAFRYAALIADQMQNGRIDADAEAGAKAMCLQCLERLLRLMTPAGANAKVPADQGQAKGWIVNDRWDQIEGLIDAWRGVLGDEPFRIGANDLAVGEPEGDE